MTESIRRRIIEQLVRDRTGSAPGLSVLLGVTKADVQYHLRKMLADRGSGKYSRDRAEVRGDLKRSIRLPLTGGLEITRNRSPCWSCSIRRAPGLLMNRIL